MALLTVLWFVAVMSALAITLVSISRDTAYVTCNAVRAIEARAAMQGAVEIAGRLLALDAFPMTGLLEWSNGGGNVRVTAVPEGGKIDLNAADETLIEGLASAVADDPGSARSLADALLDWRDPDNARRLAGAELDDYERDGGSTRPRDGPFPFVAELRSVRGLDLDLYGRLADAVTVFSGNAEVGPVPLAPLVVEAMDYALGLAIEGADNRGLGESAFDPSPESLEDGLNDVPATAFAEDPQGLYTLDIELAYDDGPSFRQKTVIWVEPPLGNDPFLVLQSSAGLVPRGAASTGASEATAGGDTWRSR
ncbi:MAG: type II secretion system protein GspK [Geminicoccaceae bacterium]